MLVAVGVMVVVIVIVGVDVEDSHVAVAVGDTEGELLGRDVGEDSRVAVVVGASAWLRGGVCVVSRTLPIKEPAARASTASSRNQPTERFGLIPRIKKINTILANAVSR